MLHGRVAWSIGVGGDQAASSLNVCRLSSLRRILKSGPGAGGAGDWTAHVLEGLDVRIDAWVSQYGACCAMKGSCSCLKSALYLLVYVGGLWRAEDGIEHELRLGAAFVW